MLLLLASAHAGLRADLDREAKAAPDIAIVCSSATEALGRLDELASSFPFGDDRADVDKFLKMFPEVTTPDGRLTLAFWQANRALRIGFDTPLSVEALAQWTLKMDDSDNKLVNGPDGWVLQLDNGQIRVDVTDGWGSLSFSEPAGQPRELDAALLATVPEDPGCALVGHLDDEKLGAVDMVLHLPFSPAPAAFGIASPTLHASDALLLEGADPPVVRTPAAPDALLSLGVGLDSIDFSVFLQGKELREARRVQSFFPVTGGTTVAFFDGQTPRFGVVVPFAVMLPAPALARRTKRVAKELELETERVDATHLVIHVDDMEILAATEKGVLYLATDAALLNGMQAGIGEPWVAGENAALAREWPIVVTSRILPRGGGEAGVPLERPMLLAVDLREGVVTGLVDLPLSLPQLLQLAEMAKSARNARKREAVEE